MFDWLNYIPHYDLMAWTFWIVVLLVGFQIYQFLVVTKLHRTLSRDQPKKQKKTKLKAKTDKTKEAEVEMKTKEDLEVVVFY